MLIGGLALKLLKGRTKEEVPPETPLPEAIMAEMEARKQHEEELEEIHLEQDPIYLKIVEIGKDYPELITNIIGKWLKEEGIK